MSSVTRLFSFHLIIFSIDQVRIAIFLHTLSTVIEIQGVFWRVNGLTMKYMSWKLNFSFRDLREDRAETMINTKQFHSVIRRTVCTHEVLLLKEQESASSL
jgi:hypothetical protein